MAYSIVTDPRGFVVLTPTDPASVAEARVAAAEVTALPRGGTNLSVFRCFDAASQWVLESHSPSA